LGANWHFDLGIGQARVRKARAELQKMLHTKEYAEQNIPLEVAKYYQDSIEAQASFQAYEKAAVASRKWVVSAFSNFDMGVGPARDILRSAIDRYGKNQGEYLLSLYNYHVSLASSVMPWGNTDPNNTNSPFGNLGRKDEDRAKGFS